MSEVEVSAFWDFVRWNFFHSCELPREQFLELVLRELYKARIQDCEFDCRCSHSDFIETREQAGLTCHYPVRKCCPCFDAWNPCYGIQELERPDVWGYIKNWWRSLSSLEDGQMCPPMNPALRKYIKKRGNGRETLKGLSFYTIAPKKRLPYSGENISKIHDFAREIFISRAEKYFNEVWFVVESGKHQDNPNLHIHALVEFNKSDKGVSGSKFFMRDLVACWKRHFSDPEYRIDYDTGGNKGIHRKACNTLDIQKESLEYMTNENKGTHENFTDLGIKGRWSVSDF